MDNNKNIDDFVTAFKVQAGQELALEIKGGCTVDWGDGKVLKVSAPLDKDRTTCVSNIYAAAGEYEVRISNTITGWHVRKTYDCGDGWRHTLRDVKQWGTAQWDYLPPTFRDCASLEQITATDAPDLRLVRCMSHMFHGCEKFNSSIEHWDVSEVLDMISMFGETAAFNQALNGWDVSKVKNMAYMFNAATAFNQPLYNWDTHNVLNMNNTFEYASAFNQDITGWDLSNANCCIDMFGEGISFNNYCEKYHVGRDKQDFSAVFNLNHG